MVLFVLVNLAVIAALASWIVYRRIAPAKSQANFSPIKPAWSYWTWRILVPLAYAAAICGAERAWATRNGGLFVAIVIGLAPLLAVTVFACFTAETFSFDYSVFGKYRRTPLPNEIPLDEIHFSYAIIGKVRTGPQVTWQFHRHGIGVKVGGIGDVFLPLEEIDSIEIRGRFLGLMSELTHHCPEVRGPIGVPNGVATIMAHYYPAKVLVAAKRI